jgi:hypothetical protein
MKTEIIFLVMLILLLVSSTSACIIQFPQKEYPGNPVFSGTLPSNINGTREAYLYDQILNGNYYLFYDGESDGSGNGGVPVWTIGVANSTNLTLWNDEGRILNVSASGWDDAAVSDARIYNNTAVNGLYYMYYLGCNGVSDGIPATGYQIGLATSSAIDGPYTKYANNPIITNGIDGQFDSDLSYATDVPIKINSTTWGSVEILH